LSTLTGNAPAIDSAVLPSGYSPSQGYWGETTGLRWWRQSTSGVAAARCDYGDQFRRSDVPSDVAVALRDFVLIPHATGGTVVLVDRAITGSPERGMHLRVRTPSSLSLVDDVATSTLGESALGITKIWSTSGTPSVRTMPHATECPSSDHNCDVSRIASGTEYRVDVAGPSAFALHVIDAQSGVGSVNSGVLISGAGYRGVFLEQSPQSVAVITNDTPDGVPGSSLTYRVPAGQGVVQVVVDAPVAPDGKSDVTATREGDDCEVEVTPYSGATSGFDGSPLILSLSEDCVVVDDGTQQPVQPDPGQPGAENPVEGQGGTMEPGAGDGTIAPAGGSNNGGNGDGSPNSGGRDPIIGGPSDRAGSPSSNGVDGSDPQSAVGMAHSSDDASGDAQGCNLQTRRNFNPFAPLAASALALLLGRGRRRLAR
jgi:hypothetical protein